MLRIGVTGSPGAGKSEVARRMARHGAEVLEADKIAHGLYEPGGPAYDSLVAAFGRDILSSDGAVKREAVRRRLLEDSSALARLNSVVHPPLIDFLRRRLERADQESPTAGKTALVVDAALLLEWGMERDFDALIVVDAPEEIRRSRMLKRPGGSTEFFDLLSAGQLPPEEKCARADYVIDSSGTLEDLYRRVDAMWLLITRNPPA